jgi:hypothetical protein
MTKSKRARSGIVRDKPAARPVGAVSDKSASRPLDSLPAGRERALAELERVTKSPALAGSRRLQRLLRFLVEETLAGRGGELTAGGIAKRFFKRGDDFDPSTDPIVRVEVGKLRRALGRCYAPPAEGALRIELPTGTFAPRFVGERDHPASSGPRSRGYAFGAGAPLCAVRAFACPGGGALAASLAQEIPRDLAARALQVPCVHVMAPSATGKVEDGYEIEGSVRAMSGIVRVMVTMREPSGRLAWGETFDRPIAWAEAEGAHAEIGSILFTQLFDFMSGALGRMEALKLRRSGRPPETLHETLVTLRQWLMTFEPDDYQGGRRAAQSILATSPDHAPLLGLLSISHTFARWTRCAEEDTEPIALALAHRALTADPRAPGANVAAALVHLAAGDGERMLDAAERVLGLGRAPAIAGFLLAIAGDWERGTGILRHEMALPRAVPGFYRHALFLDAYRRGDLWAALAEAESMETPALAWDPLDRAIALGKLGRVEEARRAHGELLTIVPAFARDPRGHLGQIVPDPALVDALSEGLSIAAG